VKGPSPKTKLLLTWALGVVALALAGVLALEAWHLSVEPERRAERESAALSDEQVAAMNREMEQLTELTNIAPPPGVESLDGSPADLAAPPGAQRLLGYASTDGGITIQTAVWSVADASVSMVNEHYSEQLTARGYTPRRQLTPNNASVSHRLYERDSRLVTVRARDTEGAVRVVIQLRYTTGRSPGSR